ncbi:hypothetical protein HYX05_02280 [Candidatus Woesearchaeota archaeon]|nr:hypothetical protein [Candidatus Woesearchaeota archaeon]
MSKKEDAIHFNSQEGKVNLALLFSIVLIFVLSLLFVNAVTITQQAPLTGVVNGTRTINFTFTVIWIGGGENTQGNCSIWTNITGVWAEAIKNGTNNTQGAVYNSSSTSSVLNLTFDSDGNFTWAVGCQNTSAPAGALNFTTNRTLIIDTIAPALTLDSPKGGVLADATSYNITSYETATLYVNVSDNTTVTVWMILNDNASITPQAPASGKNESVNRSMTAGTIYNPGQRQYYFNLSGIMNFNSSFTSPGPHSVFFCANDSIGRKTCTNRSDFIIMGMNITQMELIFTTMQQKSADGDTLGVAFGGLNITLGNGSEIPQDTFMNPINGVTVDGLTHKNFTFIINISNDIIVHIVAGSIDASQFENASNSKVNNTPTREVRQQLGTGFSAQMAWADIASFIPSEVSYLYGILQLGGIGYTKKMYCNGIRNNKHSSLEGRLYISIC